MKKSIEYYAIKSVDKSHRSKVLHEVSTFSDCTWFGFVFVFFFKLFQPLNWIMWRENSVYFANSQWAELFAMLFMRSLNTKLAWVMRQLVHCEMHHGLGNLFVKIVLLITFFYIYLFLIYRLYYNLQVKMLHGLDHPNILKFYSWWEIS